MNLFKAPALCPEEKKLSLDHTFSTALASWIEGGMAAVALKFWDPPVYQLFYLILTL